MAVAAAKEEEEEEVVVMAPMFQGFPVHVGGVRTFVGRRTGRRRRTVPASTTCRKMKPSTW